MPNDSTASLEAMIRHIERIAAGHPDPVSALVEFIKVVIVSEADPYLLAGAMLEGVAATIAQKVPAERRGTVAVEAVRLLRDRLRAWGAIGEAE